MLLVPLPASRRGQGRGTPPPSSATRDERSSSTNNNHTTLQDRSQWPRRAPMPDILRPLTTTLLSVNRDTAAPIANKAMALMAARSGPGSSAPAV